MKYARINALAVAVAIVLAAPTSLLADDPSGIPMRKAGHWELKTTMDEGRGPREQTLTMCIEAEMEKNTVAASAADHKKNCSKYEVTSTAAGTTVEAICNFNERDVTSRTEMTGDFQTAFAVKIDSTTSGVHLGQSVAIKRTIVQEGKYLGESCGDLRAGEAMGTDGAKVVVQ
jgi:hypothetical protein